MPSGPKIDAAPPRESQGNRMKDSFRRRLARIRPAPDFDHVPTVNLAGSELTDRDLNQEIGIVVPGRKNVAAERLRQGEHVEAMLSAGSSTPVKVQLEAGPEIYFEEGSCSCLQSFDPIDEEAKR